MKVERILRTGVAAATLLAAGHVLAAHPFLTEDPGTLGPEHVQVELGLASGNADPPAGGRQTLFSPQLSIGVTPTLDVIGQGVWTHQTQSGVPTRFGGGDLMADFKWRFFENDDFALAVRAGLDLPAGDPDAGFGNGGVGAHALAIVGVTRDAWAFYANAGYARARGEGTRPDLGFFSAAFAFTDLAPWQAFVEVATYSNPDPAIRQWPAIARTGLVYTVNPSLDLDVGIQARLNPSAPRVVVLAGATFRW